MRLSLVLAVPFWVVAAAPSVALDANDTMASWQNATAEEKKKLVVALLKRTGKESRLVSVVGCLDAASHAPGHGALPISEVVDACARDNGEAI